MLTSRFLAQVAVPFVLALSANAETHVIKFVNKCGSGTPALIYDGKNILTGDTYTSNGPWSGIAYLQQGYCNTNGENCTLLETTLINPTCAGCGSSTDISLIRPHAYSVETSFAYYNGCDGQGKTCSNPDCTSSAFFAPNDNFVQVACETDDVNLLVAFCADASQLVTGNPTMPSGHPMSSLPMPSGTPSKSPSVPLPTGTLMPSGYPMSSPMPSGTSSMPPSVPPPTDTLMPTGLNDTDCGDEPEPSSTPTLPTNPAGPGDSGCDDEPTTTPSSMPTPSANPASPDDSECGDGPTTTPPSTPTLPADPADLNNSGCDDVPATAPSSMPTPAVNPTNTNMPDSGCDELVETTPTQMPTNGSDPECGGDPVQTTPPNMTPTKTQTPSTTPPSVLPTVSHRRCRPRPTGMSMPAPAPTNPAYTPPPPPVSMPSVSPMTPPAGTPSAGDSNPDPCDEGGDTGMPVMPSPSPLAPVRRRHHRRGNRMSY